MGTQFQRLTTPRAWGSEAVQADSAWNMEAHDDVPTPGFSCPRGLRRPFDQGPIEVCDLGSQRRILTGTVQCDLKRAFRGDDCHVVGSGPGAAWDLNLTVTVP